MHYAASLHDEKRLTIQSIMLCRSKPHYLSFQWIKLSNSQIQQFIAKRILKDIPKWVSAISVENSYINFISLNNCYDACLIFKELLKDNEKSLLDILYEIVMMSKKSDKINIASSNAITLLNHSGYQFINKNMANIKIPNADLSGSFFFHSDLQNSNVQGVNFSQSSLLFSNFKGCSLNFQSISPFITDNAKILSFSFSPCYQWLATCNIYGKIGIWDMKNRKKFKLFSNLNVRAISLSYLPNLKLIIANLDNKSIALINTETAELKILFTSQSSNQINFVISPNKELIAVWDDGADSSDNTVASIWNLKTLERERLKDIYNNNKSCKHKIMGFSPCSQYIIYLSNYLVSFHHIYNGCININIGLMPHNTVSAIALCPIDSYSIAVGFVDGFIQLWKINSNWDGWKKFKIAKCDTSINEIEFTNNGKYLISLTQSATISIWDLFEKALVWEFPKKSIYDKYFGLKTVADGIACASDNSILIWKIEGKTKNFEGHKKAVSIVIASPRGDLIASAGRENTIKLWDLKSMKLVWEFHSYDKNTTSLAFSHCGRFLASAFVNFQIWDVDSLQERNLLKLYLKPVHSISFSHDDSSLIAGGSSRWIYIIDCKNQEIKHKLSGGKQEVKSIAVSKYGKYIAVGKYFYYIELWYKENEEWKNKRLKGYTKYICSVTFSNCEKFLLSGCSNGTTYIWDVEEGAAVKTLINGDAPNFFVTFSPCEKFIVCCVENGKIIFWNKDLGQIERKILGHDGLVTSACFSVCGEFLFTSGKDGSIKKWNVKSFLNRRDSLSQCNSSGGIELVWSSVNGILALHASSIKMNDSS
ncbi:unnamed protein product [Blepharisma stoltei]|uniref:Uncharacterized protein n=1 Tax=Blepharisma stoltei TaxID=1481888 RepID=A0AAU9IM46_9CILI|nr:unnamed protein product [Blepharisma stoltei]